MSDRQAEFAGLPRYFGRRHGHKLRASRQALMSGLLPRLAIPRPAEGEVLDPVSLFPRPVSGLWLEIGFGGGEHLAEQARRNPGVGLIGCEVFINGIASALDHLDQDGSDNVRIFPEDARFLMPALPEASLAMAFVLFPDPWPKARHAERRFIGQPNLDTLSRLMADGAELRIATDDPTYQDWAQEQMAMRPDFESLRPDPALRPEDWPETRYELKARGAGRQPIYLAYRRLPRT